MSERKIVVCSTQAEALAQRLVLERDGYTVAGGPVLYQVITWDAMPANGKLDIRDDAWLVEGVKP